MYYYIVNPAAGRSQIQGLQNRIRNRLEELGIRGEWNKTTGPGDATRMARAAVAAGHSTIVAVGGDNTVNEVINGVDKESVAIGIIPIGSSNRVANQLGILHWQQACEALAARRLTPFSLIAAGQNFFLSTLTLGFETDLDKIIDPTETSLGARIGQFGKTFGRARNFRTLHCKIDVDAKYKLECDLFNLSIANQKFLNPLAEDRLIISILDRPSKTLKLGHTVWQTLNRRTHGELEEATTRFLADRVVIETDPPTGIIVDGKVATRTPIAIRLTDRRVRFVTEKVVADFKEAVASKE